MRESIRAKASFEDYFAIGPGRSLRKLHKQYCQQTGQEPPTKRFKTLALWSRVHKWQDRIAQREAEIAATRMQDIIENAPKTGYAIWQKRVQDLGQLAERLNDLVSIPGLFSPALVREYRGLLDDIAKEMGERVRGLALSGPDGGPIELDFGAVARDTLLGRLLSSASLEDEGKPTEESDG